METICPEITIEEIQKKVKKYKEECKLYASKQEKEDSEKLFTFILQEISRRQKSDYRHEDHKK